ncbi:hypothetical protein D0Z08_15970 [Nocardioides immobilis]|uniref:Uncharacterized protein n=1 Tax=Nocardioides immobilis TaxID=2049295 RepID=A0A417Y0Q0_9ACTN|nr:hypothetical protein [Nocardioides immobilis]RHW26137.1 hypothetical protein D0Z08_15970 [Nocardioides immobilis]
MTSHLTTTPATGRQAIANWPLFAALSTGAAAVLTAVGTFWSPLADYESTLTMDEFISWLVVVAITIVGAAIVFGLVVRTTPSDGGRVRTPVLAVLAVLSLAVFWSGLPMVLAGGAVCTALVNPRALGSRVALVLAALVTIVAVWGALAG